MEAPAVANVPLTKRLNQAFDYRRLWANILANWYWIAASLTVALLGAFLYLRYTTPQYSVSATLLVDNKSDLQSQVLEKFQNQQAGGNSDIKLFNEIFILKSPDLVGAAIDSMDANVHYWVRGRVKENEIYEDKPFRLVFDASGYHDEDAGKKLVIRLQGARFQIEEGDQTYQATAGAWISRPWGRFYLEQLDGPQANALYRTLPVRVAINPMTPEVDGIISRLKVEAADGRTSMLNITLTDNLRDRALDFIHVLIHFYFRQALDNLTQSALKTRDFINEQKTDLVGQLKEKDTRVEGIKRNTQIIDPGQPATFIAGRAQSEQRVTDLVLQRQIIASLRIAVLSAGATGDRALAGGGICGRSAAGRPAGRLQQGGAGKRRLGRAFSRGEPAASTSAG